MTYLRPALVGCLLLALLAPASASADGWKFPNLNPFKREKSAAPKRKPADNSGFEFPKMSMPKMPAPKMPKMGFWPASNKKKRGPSTWVCWRSGSSEAAFHPTNSRTCAKWPRWALSRYTW